MDRKAILFLDDEIEMLNALKRSFRKSPCETFFASTTTQALEILNSRDISVLVTDQRMPEMTGIEFLKIVKNSHPRVVRAILSGFTDVQTIIDAINHAEVFRFIAKPWNEQELKDAIDACLLHHEAIAENRLYMGNSQMIDPPANIADISDIIDLNKTIG